MDKISNYDLVMVLGAGVLESKRRADYSANLVKYLDLPIIVSGGVPRKIPLLQNSNKKTESEIMKSILVRKGINEKRIFEERNAQSTYENFKNSKPLIDKLKCSRVAIVDGLTHISRSLKIANENFPQYTFGAFPVPLNYKNPFLNLTIEGISAILELTSKKNSKYRFYNNSRY